MRLAVTLEQRFRRTPDGAVWCPSTFGYNFWGRYLDVFDAVRVVARVEPAAEIPGDWARSDGPDVEFAEVPHYVGPAQYLRRLPRVRRSIRRAVEATDAVLMRVGSPIAACMEPALRSRRHPYGVEVVGDPYDVFAPGVIHHPLRPVFRHLFRRQLRRQCRNACSAAYVTATALQGRYPPAPGAFRTHYSSVELPPDAFVDRPRVAVARDEPFAIVMVGSLDQLYKGPDVLLQALAGCVRRGLDARLVVVGDGRFRPGLEVLARDLGLADRVEFRGRLPGGEAVRLELDRADLFVLPSRTEGLPRALIEAMARGLPCLGSDVGGIPELLPPEDLVPSGDAEVLGEAITRVARDPARLARMSTRNLDAARDYRDDVLKGRRLAFYRHLREQTAAWIAGREPRP